MLMRNYRTIDCEEWARRLKPKLSLQGRAVLIKITPKHPYPLLGAIRMPSGVFHSNWFYHFALLFNGRMYDEAFPNGLPEEEFKDRFESRDVLEFSEVE